MPIIKAQAISGSVADKAFNLISKADNQTDCPTVNRQKFKTTYFHINGTHNHIKHIIIFIIRTVAVPERPGRVSSRSVHFGVTTAQDSQNCHGSKSEPKRPNPANRFEKTDFERSAKHGLLCQIQSRHLNILFLVNLGIPDSCA